MKKYFIGQKRDKLNKYKTTTFSAEEDIAWYRLDCLLQENEEATLKEIRDIVARAKTEGVVFLENGNPDLEKSDKEALQKSNERLLVINNEEINTKVLPITMLHKLKVENEILSGEYNDLLQLFLKEN